MNNTQISYTFTSTLINSRLFSFNVLKIFLKTIRFQKINILLQYKKKKIKLENSDKVQFHANIKIFHIFKNNNNNEISFSNIF